jgi:16S rRNA (uracil1498-N3)-methyltransferase
MAHKRIFQATQLVLNKKIYLDERACHYLSRVLRVKHEDRITLFNGEGGEYRARITEISKQKIAAYVEEYLPIETESSISICLAQGIARGEKMDMIIQKAVELGVTHIVPLHTERSHLKLDQSREEKRLSHWRGVVISACEQSGRNRLPQLSSPMTLKTYLANSTVEAKCVLSPHASSPFTIQYWSKYCQSFSVLIGPEGGLSEEEVSLAKEAGYFAFQLGPRILRTETAPLSVLSILQFQYGDFTI